MRNQIGVVRSVCSSSHTAVVAWLEMHADGNMDILRVREHPQSDIRQVPTLTQMRLGYAIREPDGTWAPPLTRAPYKSHLEKGHLVQLVVVQ